VLVNFWATWCPPCREEIPDLIQLSQRDRSLEIAGIAMDEGNSAGVRDFVKAARIPFAVLLPAGSSSLTELIQALPTTFLIDKEGMVARQYVGAVNERTVRQDIDRLQAED
jgi:thiol-disulfide isomerase/thioredoxin